MSDNAKVIGAELLARAHRILGRPPETEEELAEALEKAQAERQDVHQSDLALRVRALELQTLDPALPESTARLMAETEAEISPVIERPHPDDVHARAVQILADSGRELTHTEDEYLEACQQAERELAARGRS